MKPALNLLNYPALDRQRKWRHRWTTSLAGGVVGVLLAWSAVQWQSSRALPIEQERQRLQTIVGAQKQQLLAQQKQQVQQVAWQQQVQHLDTVAQEHRAWEVLHQALQREAAGGALKLRSLQLTQGRLTLHGQSAGLQSMNQARERVARDLGLDLKLTSALIMAEPSAQRPPPTRARVEFVWQADWSVPRSRADKTKAMPSAVPTAKPLP